MWLNGGLLIEVAGPVKLLLRLAAEMLPELPQPMDILPVPAVAN